MNPKNMDPELRAKVDACTTPEEIVARAKEEGHELNDDELTAIAGGGTWLNCSDQACSRYDPEPHSR